MANKGCARRQLCSRFVTPLNPGGGSDLVRPRTKPVETALARRSVLFAHEVKAFWIAGSPPRARDWKSPITKHQINLSKSPMRRSIARFATLWVLKEICEGGGEAMICEAHLIDGLSDQEVRALFNATREE